MLAASWSFEVATSVSYLSTSNWLPAPVLRRSRYCCSRSSLRASDCRMAFVWARAAS